MKNVLFGFLGSRLDTGVGPDRWSRWRPTVDLFRQPDLLIHRFEMFHDRDHTSQARQVAEDIATVSPDTEVVFRVVEIDDAWDFEEVFGVLYDVAAGYPFEPEEERYLLHLTTGTHVWQICLFLLAESRHFPASLVQTSPPRKAAPHGAPGRWRIIDLDLSRYDAIAARFRIEHDEGTRLLKHGIETRDERFNRLIDRIERVAIASDAPILLTGPTGAGKTQLARRIYELKRRRNQLAGGFVEVNCATVRGDAAMSALFGHRRGAFTGAIRDREGLLKAADEGLLFLDEIGELGSDEQAMLLRAVETGRFTPIGSDREVTSSFQLIAGTNSDLREAVSRGEFREDLLARIDLWHFELPGLRDRLDDLEPNLDYELDELARRTGRRASFNRSARKRYLDFARGPEATWRGNFRDLNASVVRMATLAGGARIDDALVDEELERLRRDWRGRVAVTDAERVVIELIGEAAWNALDRFDRVQLVDVVDVCRGAATLSEAGRILFSESRKRKATRNDADRLRKYLARFDIQWSDLLTLER